MSYREFIASRSQSASLSGFDPVWMPDLLFDFQRSLVEWAIRKGRAAIFADCGLGKTPMQLVWAENVIRHTNKPVLILTPLAVGAQTVKEAGVAAIATGRRAILIEKDPRYAEIARRRVAEAMGRGKGSLLTATGTGDLFANDT